MIHNKCINKDVLSNLTKCNRHKALEIILSGGVPENKAIKNIVESVEIQTFEFLNLQKYILSKTITFSEIYNMLSDYGKGAIPVIIATLLKDNISYVVIENNEKEIDLTADLLEKIEESPSSYSLTVVSKTHIYEQYSKIFNTPDEKNIFKSITKAMQNWLFGLSKYANIVENEYIGLGKYSPIEQDTLRFKEMLRGVQDNPYWFLKYKVINLFGTEGSERLRLVKNNIDNTILRLKHILKKDLESIFPESLYQWYSNLPEYSKNRYYKDGEENFLSICKKSAENSRLIDDLSMYLTGLSIENWEDDTPTQFYNGLIYNKSVIECTKQKEFVNGFKITFCNDDKTVEKIFDLPSDENKELISLFKKDIQCLFNDYSNSIKNSAKIEAMLEVIFL